MKLRSAKTFKKDDSGVAAIEYALIISMMSIILMVAFQRVGTSINQSFQSIGAAMGTTSAAPRRPPPAGSSPASPMVGAGTGSN